MIIIFSVKSKMILLFNEKNIMFLMASDFCSLSGHIYMYKMRGKLNYLICCDCRAAEKWMILQVINFYHNVLFKSSSQLCIHGCIHYYFLEEVATQTVMITCSSVTGSS